MKTRVTATSLATLLATVSTPALAGHLFTQNTNNTPTWIQAGQGVRIDQTRMEPNYGYGLGNVDIDFAANATPPAGADTATSDWWSWSAGDVLRFTVPTDSGDLSTTIAYDAAASCAYDVCDPQLNTLFETSISATVPQIGTTNMALGQAEVSETTPLTWTLEALAGEFSLAGYRIYFPNGTLNGTGAAPLSQSSVVDSGDLGGNTTPDIDTSRGSYLLSDLDAGNVTSTFEGGTLTVDAPASVGTNFAINAAGGRIDTNGFATTISGQLSGAGTFTKSGEGTLVLSAENSHAGGTTVTGGTLEVSSNGNLGAASGALTLDGGALGNTASFDLARPVVLGPSGGTIRTGEDLLISDTISGSGALSKAGDDALVLTGANSYSGGTVVSGGSVVVSSNTNFGDPSGTLTLDGGTVGNTASFDLARPVVLGTAGGSFRTDEDLGVSGTISGSGALAKSGDGVLVLSGENKYGGGTSVTGGTLVVTSDAGLGSGAGILSLDGGALGAIESFGLARPLEIEGGGGRLETGDDALLSVTGPVGGMGDLTVSGNVALGGTGFSHSGSLRLAEGLLVLNGDITSPTVTTDRDTLIGGAGALAGTLDVAGTLSPGNSPGTMTVGGDVTLAPTATARFEIDGRAYDAEGGAGTYDRLVVTGPDAVFTAAGTIAPVLRGISGAATNSFTPIIGDIFRVVTTADEAGIAGAFADIAQPEGGLAEGQRFAVRYGGDYIDLVVAPTSFLAFAEPLGNDNIEAAAEAVDRIVARGEPEAQPLSTGVLGLAPGPLVVALEQTSGEIHAFALDAIGTGITRSAQALGDTVSTKPRDEAWWVDASGSWNESASTSSGSAFDDTAGHLLIGRDLYRTAAFNAGLAFGYGSHDLDTEFGAGADVDTYLLAAYGVAEHGNLVFDTMLAATWSDLDTTRDLYLSTGSYSAHGSGDITSAVLGLGVSYRHALGAAFGGRAWARLVATAMKADGYDETGTDIGDLSVDDAEEEYAVASLGYELSREFGSGAWTLGVGLEQSSGRAERDLSLLGEAWRVSAAKRDTIGFATAGLRIHPADNASLQVDVQFREGDDWDSRSIGASYSVSW